MNDRKGMSALIGMVLLVLLALFAVGIVWFFLAPVFSGTGTKVKLDTLCFEAQIDADCEIVNGIDNHTDLFVNVTSKVKKGDVARLRIVLNRNNSESANVSTIDAPNILATKKLSMAIPIDFTSPGGLEDYQGALPSVTVAAIVEDDEGNEEICNARTFRCDYEPSCSPGLCGLCDNPGDCADADGGAVSCDWLLPNGPCVSS